MAELTFPSGVAPKVLPQGYGQVGADEAAYASAYGRGIRGDPGIMLPQLMQARRMRQATDDAIMQQTERANRQGQDMYNDYMPRAENAQRMNQAADIVKAGKAPFYGMKQLRDLIAPGADGAIMATDEQNFMKGEAEIDKTSSEALNQRATAANQADQAGITPPSALLRLGNFQKGLSRQERVQQIQNAGNIEQEKIKGENGTRPKYEMTPDPVTGKVTEKFTGGNPKQVRQMYQENQASDMPASARPGSPSMANMAGASGKVEQHIKSQGAQVISKTQQSEGGKMILRYRVRTQDGQTRDLEYEVGPNGQPSLRKR